MTNREQKKAIKDFVDRWKNRGEEKSDTQKFWLDLLQNVFNVHEINYINFEKEVELNHISYIDAYIENTKILIEQKSLGIDLRKEHKQSDGTFLNAYGQAKRYADWLGSKDKPRYIITCNFKSFLIYDQEHPRNEPEEIFLENLTNEYSRLSILVSHENPHLQKEMELSFKAGSIVGKLYNAIIGQYKNSESESTLKSLNILCVRLVFCLYAEDAEIFGNKNQFYDYLAQFKAEHLRDRIIRLFKVLNTKIEDRDPYLENELKAFPYVNGGLFDDENIEIPQFNEDIKKLLLDEASNGLDWKDISPTIFGALFESTLNPVTRRTGGMHYTSIENIHKVIDPLFLDSLKEELKEILASNQVNVRKRALIEFQDKLASLTFLDPACGSGNFLTETYLSLRELENKVLLNLFEDGQRLLNLEGTIKVSIKQFYGIEINDFAVTVAKTALWIAESQMMKKTEEIIHADLDFLPLKSYTNIVEANALQIDWESVVPKEKLNYIMGNPPFVGARLMGKEQKNDLFQVFHTEKKVGDLDYVCCWYKIATNYIANTKCEVALVATNSITQGVQVELLWRSLFQMGVHINFAYQTFQWDSEANIKAHVHCVIIGFSMNKRDKLTIYDVNSICQNANIINPYLIDAPIVFIGSRSKPICNVPQIGIGNKPIDNGNYLFTEVEKEDFIKKEPKAEKYFKPWYGSEEFINNKKRFCLWVGDCSPKELLEMPEVLKRIDNVRKYRLSSPSLPTIKLAEKPTRFHVENMPDNDYIIIPSTSSERRKYIPLGFLNKDSICSNATHIIPNATLYHFGVLTSLVHNAWMRVVCGRLKSDYRYSKDIVYNNFPWPDFTKEHEEKITTTAQMILDVRSQYPDCSLADLYGDKMYLFNDLVQAHKANDIAVMNAYGFKSTMDEVEMVAELMKMYQKLIKA